jgi:hypothetical protein
MIIGDAPEECDDEDDGFDFEVEIPEASGSVPRDVKAINLASALATWLDHARTGPRVLSERDAAMAAIPVGRSAAPPHEMSVISRNLAGRTFVNVVSWSEVSIRTGVYVTVRNGKAVYPTAQRSTSFADADIVHPAIGCRLQRSVRSPASADILHLMSQWDASHGGWHDLMPTCYCCSAVIDDDAIGARTSDDPMQRGTTFCLVCLLASHKSCLEHVQTTCVGDPSDGVLPPVFELPARFKSRACCLCLAWLG